MKLESIDEVVTWAIRGGAVICFASDIEPQEQIFASIFSAARRHTFQAYPDTYSFNFPGAGSIKVMTDSAQLRGTRFSHYYTSDDDADALLSMLQVTFH